MHVPCISTPSQFICVAQLSEITTSLRVFVPLLKEKYYSVCKECPTGMIHCCGCFEGKITVGQVYTVQLKGNLIPVCMLQVEYCRVKITSCVQYLSRHPLRSCMHQANCLACAPVNVILILNELLNKTCNINSIYTMNLRILSLCVPWSY